MRDQKAEARIRIDRGAEAGDLAHRPGLRAIHRGVRAARVGELPRETRVAEVIVFGEIGRRVEPFERDAAESSKLFAPLGPLLRKGQQRQLLPLALRFDERLVRRDIYLSVHRSASSSPRRIASRLSTMCRSSNVAAPAPSPCATARAMAACCCQTSRAYASRVKK